MAHAPFAPSAAKRWINCPGSFALSLTRPEPPEGPYAAEGTRLHDLAAAWLAPIAADDRLEVSSEDILFLKPYLLYAERRMKECDVWAVEEHIHLSDLLSGTPDLMLMFKEQSLLEVVDLKTGAGVMVDPVENDQMLAYGYMALMKLSKDGVPPPRTIRLTVAQPPNEAMPIRSWDTTSTRVLAWGTAAHAAIEIALAGGAPVVPGEWCRFCKAKPVCPALRGEVIEALGTDVKPESMTPAALATWLDRADRMDQFISAVREAGHDFAYGALRQGQPGIPGWGLKPKRATRQWADEDKVLEIARRRKIKIWQDKLMSPAMAEKAHPKLPEELTEQIVSVSSGTNLVRMETPPAQVLNADANRMEKLMANFNLMQYRK